MVGAGKACTSRAGRAMEALAMEAHGTAAMEADDPGLLAGEDAVGAGTSSSDESSDASSDTEGSDAEQPTIDLSDSQPPDMSGASQPAAPPSRTAAAPCPDCMRRPNPGDSVCICGVPLARTAVAPATAPARAGAPQKAGAKKAGASKTSKVHRWYVEVSRRLTGVPRFVIKDAQQIYRKALQEKSRPGCSEQGGCRHVAASRARAPPARTRAPLACRWRRARCGRPCPMRERVCARRTPARCSRLCPQPSPARATAWATMRGDMRQGGCETARLLGACGRPAECWHAACAQPRARSAPRCSALRGAAPCEQRGQGGYGRAHRHCSA